MKIKLIRHNKEKRTITLRMDEEAFRKMYDTLFYTIYGRLDSNQDGYADEFSKIWNEVCRNFEVRK